MAVDWNHTRSDASNVRGCMITKPRLMTSVTTMGAASARRWMKNVSRYLCMSVLGKEPAQPVGKARGRAVEHHDWLGAKRGDGLAHLGHRRHSCPDDHHGRVEHVRQERSAGRLQERRQVRDDDLVVGLQLPEQVRGGELLR